MKAIRTIIISILICMCLFVSAFAVQSEEPPAGVEAENSEIQPRGEETRWYFREIDGVKQARLWSLTYGRWLTDWITY
ncbi:MAG: hypothetical protein E7444_07140 [Ruminococcaceae bacterium]|nr:hypothetical protein [Oscillospiraceae bacterium]